MRRTGVGLRVAAGVVALALAAGAAQGASGTREFRVEDSIGLSAFAPPGDLYLQAATRVATSPDGRYSLAVTVRGDLASDRRVATLWVIDHKDLEGFLRSKAKAFGGARAIAEWGTASNEPPVSRWRWSSDGRSILFLGADDRGSKRLFRVALAGGAPVPLTSVDRDITQYDERNGAVVYLAHAPFEPTELNQAAGPSLPDVVIGTGRSVLDLIFPNHMEQLNGRPDTLWRLDGGAEAKVVDARTGAPVVLKNSRLILSADGRRVLATRQVPHIPKAWERYHPADETAAFQIVADKDGEAPVLDSIYRAKQYISVDLASGEVSPIVDAPIDIDAQFVDVGADWSDPDRVVLVGAYPPLASAPAGAAPLYPCALGIADIPRGAFTCLEPVRPHAEQGWGKRSQVVGLAWRPDGTLRVRRAAPNTPYQVSETRYRQGRGGWTASTAASAPGSSERVRLREGIDQPPVLVARDAAGVDRVVLDPNPQLAGLAMGSAAPYSWRDADGDLWTGAIVRPPGFTPGRRYPLVVQTHGLDPTAFLVDGPAPTGFAARAFAARDMVVLQVREIPKAGNTPQESPVGAAAYRAAIAQLAKEGLIDPARVGIVAWSHYGGYVIQGLVDDPSTYRAAIFAEASFNAYPEFLINVDYMGRARQKLFEAQVGVPPFGEGLKTWMQAAPGFRSDRVCAPVLFQVNSPSMLLYGWDSYAALRAQGKPVDLLYMRNGAHVLLKPAERLIEQQQSVDWFDYWLNGRKDPDPAKAAQYVRWDALKPGPVCGGPAASPQP